MSRLGNILVENLEYFELRDPKLGVRIINVLVGKHLCEKLNIFELKDPKLGVRLIDVTNRW